MATRSNELYVIKEGKGNAYVFLHGDKKDVSPEWTDLEHAMKFTREEIQFIHKNFTSVWNRDDYQVYKIEMKEVRNYSWNL